MCALLAMCAYCTEENGKLKYLKATLQSILVTVSLDEHRIIVIDNSPLHDALWFIQDQFNHPNFQVIKPKENLGTAGGINLAIRKRLPNEVVIKTDDDIVWHQSGWVEELEQVFVDRPDIGICGLKRPDVYGDFTVEGNLQIMPDIMGSCTAFNPALMDKCGYMRQPSLYGFDDSDYSTRSIVAGFKNAYLPHIKIDHIDEGNSEYTEWKKREAGLYLQEIGIIFDKYKLGEIDYYYDGAFDEN